MPGHRLAAHPPAGDGAPPRAADLLDIVSLLYEGVTSAAGWRHALARLAQETGSAQAHLLVWDHDGNRFRISEGFCEDADAHARFMGEYNAEFQTIDPSKLVADRVALGTVYQDHRNLGAFVIDKSPFYGDFFHRYGLHANMASRLARRGDIEYVLSFQRERLHGNYRPRDEAVLLELMPHLVRAAQLRLAFSQLEDQVQLSAAVLDRLSFPVLVVAPSGEPVLSNAEGRAWAQAPDGVLRRSAASPERLQLLKAIRTACGLLGRRRSVGVSLRRPTGTGTGTTTDHALAIPLQDRIATSEKALALLVVQGAPWRMPDLASLLRDLFGLSPAESRLARLLFEDLSVQEAADRVGVSVATARTQLKAIFAKTQVGRQSELIRLLSRFAVVDAPGERDR